MRKVPSPARLSSGWVGLNYLTALGAELGTDRKSAFREKPGMSQVRFCLFSFFPSCGFLPFEPGPPLSPSFHPHSWLSDFRSVHGGRSQFSRCCYLIIDLCFPLSKETGPGTGAVT